jgi:hypothetical protein
MLKLKEFIFLPIILIGCGYYPHNQAAIAIPDKQTITITGAVIPTTVKKKANENDDIIRIESLASMTWKFGDEKLFVSPSLFYIGLGSGVGYIFDTKTVVASFIGTSFYPTSLASGVSISQAILDHYFIEYRLNYSMLHYKNCTYGCIEGDESELSTYNTINFAAKFGMFYSEFNVEAASLKKEYLTYGLSMGVQIKAK